MKKILFLFGLMFGVLAFSKLNAQDHSNHNHAPTDTIASQMKKLFYGMKFHDLYDPNIVVSIEDMPADTPVFIMYYNPDCGHCVLDAQRLNGLVQQYEIPFWIISSAEVNVLQDFAKKNHFEEIPNMKLIHDVMNGMHNWFNFRYIPFFALIDKQGNLIKEFENLPSPEVLKDVIQTNKYLEEYMNEE